MMEESGTKWLRAGRLIDLLGNIPANSRVSVNTVGNLMVLDPLGEDMIAYIDFAGDGGIEETFGKGRLT